MNPRRPAGCPRPSICTNTSAHVSPSSIPNSRWQPCLSHSLWLPHSPVFCLQGIWHHLTYYVLNLLLSSLCSCPPPPTQNVSSSCFVHLAMSLPCTVPAWGPSQQLLADGLRRTESSCGSTCRLSRVMSPRSCSQHQTWPQKAEGAVCHSCPLHSGRTL